MLLTRGTLGLLLALTAAASGVGPPPRPAPTLRYLRPSKGKFVLESKVTEVTTKQGLTYTSLTDRGSEKMTLTIRFDDKGLVRDAQAVRETAKGKETVAVVFAKKEATLTRQGKSERLAVTP